MLCAGVRAGYFCCAVVWLSTDCRQVVKLQLHAALCSLELDYSVVDDIENALDVFVVSCTNNYCSVDMQRNDINRYGCPAPIIIAVSICSEMTQIGMIGR